MSVAERYSAPFAEDYKEKLTCEVEGREWSGPAPRTTTKPTIKRTGTGGMGNTSTTGTPRSGTPLGGGQKQRNEAYFEKMGAENANRSADLPPSQGGKYGGFGSTPIVEPSVGGGR